MQHLLLPTGILHRQVMLPFIGADPAGNGLSLDKKRRQLCVQNVQLTTQIVQFSAAVGSLQSPQGQGRRTLHHHRRPQGDAGIVAAADGDFCVGHSFKVDGLLRLGDGGGGAEGHGELHRHPVGDAAVDAAAVIGGRPDPPTICTPRVVGLTAPEGGKLLPGPEGHRLHAGDGEHVAGNLRLHRLPPVRAAPAGGQARDDAAHLTAHGVPLLSGLLRPLAQGIFVNNLCIYFNIL